MARSSSVAGELERLCLNHKPLSPHFFKVIVHPLDQGLGLPEAFLQKYVDSLENLAILKDPNGAEWEIELRHHNGGMWLRKGLKEFGEFYSVEKNHFLVFRYEGKSHFHVIIFDSSALEINYPLRSTHRCDGDDHETTEILEETREIAEAKIEWEWIEVNDSMKMLEGISAVNKNAEQMEKDGNPDPGSSSMLINRRRRLRPRISGEGTSKTPVQSSMSCSKAVKKAATIAVNRRAPKTNHPSFSTSVLSSQIVRPHTVCVPIKFAIENFGGDCKKKYKVRLPKSGKTWTVRVSVRGRRAHIHGTGWRSFATENGLKVGEFCTFELVKRRRLFKFYRRG